MIQHNIVCGGDNFLPVVVMPCLLFLLLLYKTKFPNNLRCIFYKVRWQQRVVGVVVVMRCQSGDNIDGYLAILCHNTAHIAAISTVTHLPHPCCLCAGHRHYRSLSAPIPPAAVSVEEEAQLTKLTNTPSQRIHLHL